MARTTTGFRLVQTLSGGPPAKRSYPATVSTSYKAGMLLRFDGTTGRVEGASTSTALAGVAAHDLASQATVQQMMVYLAVQDNIFAARAHTAGATASQAVVGDKRKCEVQTTWNYRIRSTVPTAGQAQVRIVGYDPLYDTSDYNGSSTYGVEYYVQILGSASMLGSGTQV